MPKLPMTQTNLKHCPRPVPNIHNVGSIKQDTERLKEIMAELKTVWAKTNELEFFEAQRYWDQGIEIGRAMCRCLEAVSDIENAIQTLEDNLGEAIRLA